MIYNLVDNNNQTIDSIEYETHKELEEAIFVNYQTLSGFSSLFFLSNDILPPKLRSNEKRGFVINFKTMEWYVIQTSFKDNTPFVHFLPSLLKYLNEITNKNLLSDIVRNLINETIKNTSYINTLKEEKITAIRLSEDIRQILKKKPILIIGADAICEDLEIIAKALAFDVRIIRATKYISNRTGETFTHLPEYRFHDDAPHPKITNYSEDHFKKTSDVISIG